MGGAADPGRMGSGHRRGAGLLQPTDPTDPEVPAAKRLRAARRKRTMLLAGAAFVALLVALFALLYRMGQQVTTARPAASGMPIGSNMVEPSEDLAKEHARGTPPSPAGDDEPMFDAPAAGSDSAQPSASGRAGSVVAEPPPANPKPPTNREIFRRPTF